MRYKGPRRDIPLEPYYQRIIIAQHCPCLERQFIILPECLHLYIILQFAGLRLRREECSKALICRHHLYRCKIIRCRVFPPVHHSICRHSKGIQHLLGTEPLKYHAAIGLPTAARQFEPVILSGNACLNIFGICRTRHPLVHTCPQSYHYCQNPKKHLLHNLFLQNVYSCTSRTISSPPRRTFTTAFSPFLRVPRACI